MHSKINSLLVLKPRMIDLITAKYGYKCELITNCEESHRIKYILYTWGDGNFIIKNVIFSFNYITTLDHRILYLDVDIGN